MGRGEAAQVLSCERMDSCRGFVCGMALFVRLATVLCFPLRRGGVRHRLVCASFYSM